MDTRRKTIRSRIAALAEVAQELKKASAATAPFSLAFITNQAQIPNPEIVIRALPKGAAVILRDYACRNRKALAQRLKSVCKARSVSLIISADVELAKTVGADGLHIPTWFEPVKALIDDNLIITASCHNAAEIRRAHRLGAHAALLSPVFPTASHPGQPHLGVNMFRKLAAASPLPVIALGGVDQKNAARLAGPNIAGVAAISAFSGLSKA